MAKQGSKNSSFGKTEVIRVKQQPKVNVQKGKGK